MVYFFHLAGGRIIDILLKETDTQWMFTLTGTCAEIEDDENVLTKKGESKKTSKEDAKSDKKDSSGKETTGSKREEEVSKDDGETTDAPPTSIKDRKLSKDASTETEPEDKDSEEKEPSKPGDGDKDEDPDSSPADVDKTKAEGRIYGIYQ